MITMSKQAEKAMDRLWQEAFRHEVSLRDFKAEIRWITSNENNWRQLKEDHDHEVF